MGVSLTKPGANVSLSKEGLTTAAASSNDAELSTFAASLPETGLTEVYVGLGWDPRTTTGTKFDLDASAILVGSDGKVLSDAHFVFYGTTRTDGKLLSPDGSVEHTGDNLTGEGDGDDEQIKVHLGNVPAEVDKIVFPVAIYDADQRQQNFGMVRNAYIRIVDQATSTEIARFDLGEDYATETAVLFGELYRNNGTWKFRAVGQGYASGLAGIASDFGVNV